MGFHNPVNGADEKKVSASYLEQKLDELNTDYVRERSKGKEAQFEKMLEIAFAVVMLVMHIDAKERTFIMRTLDKDMKECVKLIQGTQVSWIGIACTVVSSVISLAGVYRADQNFSALGTTVGNLSQIPQSWNQSYQTLYMYQKEKAQRAQQETGEAKSQKQQAVQQAYEGINKVHDAWSRAAGGILGG